MRIVAGTHVHNAERWIGYAIASVLPAVDEVLVGISRQTTDKTRLIVESMASMNGKIKIYDNDRCDLVEGGFGTVKTDMIKRCGEMGADWILNFDHDHVYYPIEHGVLHKLAEEQQKLGFNGIKFRQYFVYSGIRTLPLDPEVNKKATNAGYSMFASFFKFEPDLKVTGEVHETVKIKGAWTFHPEFDFAHVGPLGLSDWETVEKELFYAKLNHKLDSEDEEIEWLKKCQEIKFFPECMIDFTARRRLEYPLGLPLLSEVKEGGLPPVLDKYINGSHALDIEYLKGVVNNE